MPFNPEFQNSGDPIRSQDWNDLVKGIADLFEKMSGTAGVGHQHTGGDEEGPQIAEAGLANNAVSTAKIQDLAITAAKIATNAVTAAKIADGAVGSSELQSNAVSTVKIANNAVSTAKIANNAVSTAKIANAAVTAAKIASGVIPQIGVAVTEGMENDEFIPVPSGYSRSECVFFAALKYINVPNEGIIINTNVSSQGKITISQPGFAVLMGLALGKKGGW